MEFEVFEPKYVQLNFYRSTVKIKASYASMESVSHAEFWNSAAFATMPAGASYGQEGRMIECSREILSRYLLSACNSVVVSVVELNPSLTVTLTFANVVR